MIETYKKFLSKKPTEIRALEIGPGSNPALDDFFFGETFYIDHEFPVEESKRVNKNFLNYKKNQQFDIIYERLCWHEQNKNDWHEFLNNVVDHLAPNGLFISEHSISHKKMYFYEEHLEYKQSEMELYDKNIESVIRFIPTSSYIEETLIKKKLNIKYFKIPFGQKVILSRNDAQTRNTDPDLLHLMAQKTLDSTP